MFNVTPHLTPFYICKNPHTQRYTGNQVRFESGANAAACYLLGLLDKIGNCCRYTVHGIED